MKLEIYRFDAFPVLVRIETAAIKGKVHPVGHGSEIIS